MRLGPTILMAGLAIASTMITATPEALSQESPISATNIIAHIARLSSDELGGRAPGSEGERLTVDYLVGEFKRLGLTPGNTDGTYVQKVPLVGTTVTNRPQLTLKSDSFVKTLKNGSEFMGWTSQQNQGTSVEDAELVFVGYGIVAPEYDWDDFKGTDVKGKIVVMLVNDPPSPDETLFGGRAMTYYGRWTYKFESAALRGAAGAIVIHNTEAAGYPWAVVENSWAGEQFDIVRANRGEDLCRFESWITEETAVDLFAHAGMSFEKQLANAARREFVPVPLGVTGTVTIKNRIRTLSSHNVVARVEGTDPDRRIEHVIYTAHWDHLGIGNAVDGDSIYNGALDNASGVGGVLEIARAFVERKSELKRSVLFLITTAEESGLLGAKHYADNPIYPLSRTVANINIDGVNIWGRTRDMVVVGFGQSDLDTYLQDALEPMNRFLVPDSEPEKGYYYRSDHFPFAKQGVPALYSDSGIEFIDKPEGWGLERRADYVSERYHKPQDELDTWWDLSGAVEDMTALFLVGLKLASTTDFPQWSEKSEFRSVRQRSAAARR